MKILGLYTFAAVILLACIANAACLKLSQKQKVLPRNERRLSRIITTTLAPQIQDILTQLKDSKFLKSKDRFRELMKQLKDIFQTTTTTAPSCAKCNKNT